MSDLGASAMAAIKPLATMALEDHDANASARKFALSIPEDDLYKESLKYINGRHFKYPSDHPVVWVKFGGRERQAEADTQRLARNRVRKEHRADIHIPEVFRVVTRAEGGTYIIMELLKATLLKDCVESSLKHCYDLIADGIQLLCRMPVPEDATPGPYAHDHKLRVIRHQIFADYQASTVYRSIGELEGHITRARARAPRMPTPPPPSFDLEQQLVFCYCDFNDRNFLFKTNPAGQLQLYILDFEHASFLPLSFLSFSLFFESPRWITAAPLIERIGHSLPTANLDAMKEAAYLFHISTNRFGRPLGQPPTHGNVPHQGAPTDQNQEQKP